MISHVKKKKKKKKTVYTLSVEKQQRKEWKINRKKTESPSPKFTACDLIWEKKTKQTRTKTRVKQYKNPPISLFSKSKHMPRHPHGSSSSFTSLTPSYCFCFCCTKTKNPKPKKSKTKVMGCCESSFLSETHPEKEQNHQTNQLNIQTQPPSIISTDSVPIGEVPSFSEFSFSDLKAATNNFSSDFIVSESGEKAPNLVYKGRLHNRRWIAVKKFTKLAWPDPKQFAVKSLLLFHLFIGFW